LLLQLLEGRWVEKKKRVENDELLHGHQLRGQLEEDEFQLWMQGCLRRRGRQR
jgi:hypothetical protein